jgi:hypothetical protein
MAKLDIQKQKELSFVRIFTLTLTAIRYRLFRSLVTMVVIGVAIAFMMNTLSEAISKTAVHVYAEDELRSKRLASQWAARLTMVPGERELLELGARHDRSDSIIVELRRMGDVDDEALATFLDKSPMALRYASFFDNLEFGKRKILLGDAAGVEAFSVLQEKKRFDRFMSEFESMRSLRLPGGIEGFSQFLKSWPVMHNALANMQQGRTRAIAEVDTMLKGTPVMAALARADKGFGERVRHAGFALSDDQARQVAAQAHTILQTRQVTESFKHPDVITKIAARMNKQPSEVGDSTIWKMLSSEKQADWYVAQARDAQLAAGDLSGGKVAALAQSLLENKRLDAALKRTQETGGGFLGMGSRMSWLVFLSMLVCGVGITNAMLMSVTERFREIATMKCLGSLDSFIMRMFILEAAMIGVVGGLVGGLLGMALGLGRMLLGFGSVFVNSFSPGGLFIGLIVSLIGGIIIASLASLYPSWVAARLAPMEAMRIE